jgi:alpha-galactosidase
MPVVDMTQPMPVADKIDTPPASDQMEVVPESDMTQVMDGLDMTMVDRPLLAAIEAAEREGDSPEESDALRDSDDMPLETEGNSHE